MHSFFILTTTMSILKKVKPGFQMSVHEADWWSKCLKLKFEKLK